MCGIVGYISKYQGQYSDAKTHFMRFALSLDTLRGADSTGVMTITQRFKVDIVKTTLPGDRFVQSPRYKKQVKPGWAQVGHNRAATKGKVSKDNAHPFVFGPITMVHNGTLFAGGTNLTAYESGLEVDSMQIANALKEVEPDKAGSVMTELDGSYALVWYDNRDESVNMVRNSERPLHFSVNNTREIMWFMSDKNHLRSIMKSMQGRKEYGSTIYSLDKHLLLKWKKGNMVPEVTKIVPFVRKVKSIHTAVTTVIGRTKTNSKNTTRTAMERATEKWNREQAEKAKSSGTTKRRRGSEIRVPVGTSIRKIPNAMLDALNDEYSLTPDQLLQFQPEGNIELGHDQYQVFGEVIIPSWGGSPWNAYVINAKQTQINAFSDQDWLVRPIGIGPPWNSKAEAPSIMCQLIHCAWDDYYETNKVHLEAEYEAEVEGKVENPMLPAPTTSGFVIGPGHIAMPYYEIAKPLSNGCISCGGNISIQELRECVRVNEDRDLLCAPCVKERMSEDGPVPELVN